MESDILRQNSLALSPWPSKALLNPTKYNHTCWTCVDRFSRWCKALPMPDMTLYTTARTFLGGWVARYGVPEGVVIDRRRQFKSELFHKMSQLLGTKNIYTTVYHPQANGIVERLHCSYVRSWPHQMVGTTTSDTPGTSHYSEEGVEVFSCRRFVKNHIVVTGTILPQHPTKCSGHDILHW